MSVTNNFVINVATVNGSGSQTANLVLLKSLFKMGIPVGGRNVFPSNIQGLPTWFWIRASEKGYLGRREQADIVVAMNSQTISEDFKSLRKGGVFIYNSEIAFTAPSTGEGSQHQVLSIPMKTLVDETTEAIKLKKLLINMIYVGILGELLKIPDEILKESLHNQLGDKPKAYEENLKALKKGQEYVRGSLATMSFPFKAQTMSAPSRKILIDGNSAAALGAVMGGCTVVSWYPITPSSSLAENFSKYAEKYRKDGEDKNTFAVVQAEDELSSICMVLGAGWAGARAMTATSGPGLSLMQEAAGFAYYAEIPSVIWDVQRVGPSTGMPTRTSQSDIYSALYSSHGDTLHPVLLPGNPKECYKFAQEAFDLAERLQTIIFVLSDLDIGMNVWMQDEFSYPEKPFDRGKIMTQEMIEKLATYERYGDPDGDGIPYRVLPGVKHPAAAYLTRGSGHNSKAQYTENAIEYRFQVDRLIKKWQTAKKYVPAPMIHYYEKDQVQKIGFIAYGSTDAIMTEVLDVLSEKKMPADYLRIRAFPLTDKVAHFIQTHDQIYVIDQNRDGQMFSLLLKEYPDQFKKMKSIRHYYGTPITADFVVNSEILFENREGV